MKIEEEYKDVRVKHNGFIYYRKEGPWPICIQWRNHAGDLTNESNAANLERLYQQLLSEGKV